MLSMRRRYNMNAFSPLPVLPPSLFRAFLTSANTEGVISFAAGRVNNSSAKIRERDLVSNVLCPTNKEHPILGPTCARTA